MFGFITKRNFFVNLLAAIVLVAALLFGLLWMLGFITNHGAYEKTPNITGKNLKEGIKILESKGFNVEVQDSVYIDTVAALQIIKQTPEADEMVKSKRTIFLTVNRSQPPSVQIPNMVGFSLRNAILYMKQLGLKIGDTTRKLDIAKDAILEQNYQGKPIKPGTKIFMGSTIDFVVGNGVGDKEFKVPSLIGLTYREASELLRGMNLGTGSLVVDPGVKDTANAFVYKQTPDKTTKMDSIIVTNYIREGQGINLWLSKAKKVTKTDDDDNKSPANKEEDN